MARRRLTADLVSAGIYESMVGDAALVVTELLSNAIRHAAPLPGAKVRVAWTLNDDALRVAVSDAGGGPLPRVTRAAPAAPGGRGLGIVETGCYGTRARPRCGPCSRPRLCGTRSRRQ